MFWQSLKMNLETTCCILYSIKLMKACWKDILQKKKKVSPLWTSRHNLTRRRNRRTFGRGGGLGRMVFRGNEDGIGRRKQNVKKNYIGNWQPINSQWGEITRMLQILTGRSGKFPLQNSPNSPFPNNDPTPYISVFGELTSANETLPFLSVTCLEFLDQLS